MASPKYQSVKTDDPDSFRLSSLDDDSRPKTLLQHDDLESGRPPDAPLPIEEKTKTAKSGSGMMITWVIINTIATICIVFLNKAIFDDPQFRNAQLSFVTYHFALTGLMLYTLSRPSFAWFEPKWGKASQILPIAIMFGFQVVLPNCSLAFSSIVFYQMARVLLTPFTAMINFFMYKQSITRQEVFWLIPVCIGMGILSYYEAVPQNPHDMKTTSFLGVFFAISGCLASALYTVWIKVYQVRLDMNPSQLLANQAPYGALLLLYLVPFTDTFPVLTEVSMNRWTAIFLSGVCACALNLSQFFIVVGVGPVASTVVGHLKTCIIVSLGWIVSRRSVDDKSILGVLMALAGMTAYKVVEQRARRK